MESKELKLSLNYVDGEAGLPTEDGWYLVITYYSVTYLEYTVEGGWNTCYNFDKDKLYTGGKIEFENPYYWTEVESLDELQEGLRNEKI